MMDPLFHQFFNPSVQMYWYVPLNPYRQFKALISRRQLILGHLCYYFVLCSQALVMFLYAMFIINAISTGGDFLVTAETFVWLILVINASQFVYFSMNSAGQLGEIYRSLYEIFPKTEEDKGLVNARDWAAKWTFKMKVQNFVFIFAITGMMVNPILLSLFHYFQNGTWIDQLPLHLWFPFDEFRWPIYPLVYLVEVWFFLVNSLVIVAVVASLGAVSMLICLQFKSAAQRFRSIEFGQSYKRDLLALEQAIQYHNRVLDISTSIRQVFSFPLFFISIISSMVICIFMFMVVNAEQGYDRLQYSANLISFLVFCLWNSYFGNELIEHVSI